MTMSTTRRGPAPAGGGCCARGSRTASDNTRTTQKPRIFRRRMSRVLELPQKHHHGRDHRLSERDDNWGRLIRVRVEVHGRVVVAIVHAVVEWLHELEAGLLDELPEFFRLKRLFMRRTAQDVLGGERNDPAA